MYDIDFGLENNMNPQTGWCRKHGFMQRLDIGLGDMAKSFCYGCYVEFFAKNLADATMPQCLSFSDRKRFFGGKTVTRRLNMYENLQPTRTPAGAGFEGGESFAKIIRPKFLAFEAIQRNIIVDAEANRPGIETVLMAECIVTGWSRGPLVPADLTPEELTKEGCPGLTPDQFISEFWAQRGPVAFSEPRGDVTRIEYDISFVAPEEQADE